MTLFLSQSASGGLTPEDKPLFLALRLNIPYLRLVNAGG
jgi:hypothetical protein